jgi:hypothetical protein
MTTCPELPKKPYDSFYDYVMAQRQRCSHDRAYPCFNCDGRGKVRDPKDRDPYEGYKLAPWYTCNTCNGSGESSRSVYKAMYKKTIDNWRDRYAEAKKRRDVWLRAYHKLTPLERLVLGVRYGR